MKYTGLIGYPVAHSLLPRMQEVGFAALGIEARYRLWETPANELEARIQSLRAPEMFGANIAMPYREAVLSWLDEIDPQAARIGAINTIVNRAGRLIGYNTDAPGFLRALQERGGSGFALRGRQAVVLGSGGAAREVAVALLDNQVSSLTILGRTGAHVGALVEHLHQQSGAYNVRGVLLETFEARHILGEAEVVVNATSVGLKPNDEAELIDVGLLSSSALVLDMIFNPPQTRLLREAAEHGCLTLNGLSMLLYQGALALELWTGQNAPEEVMRAALGL